MDRTRLLFLAANPDSTAPLHAGREVRRIRERLAGARHGSALEIVERWAIRPADLQQALVETAPHIVHFSGHGNAAYELMLEGDDGSPRPVGAGVLAELFRLRGEGVRLVVLSACHSLPQAEAIAEHVGAAIGMRRAIGSEAAAELSAALYHALGSGDSIRRAFESARLHLEASGNPEHRTPQLVVRREGVDLDRPLVRRPPSAVLPHAQILRAHGAAVSAGLASSRAALLGGIDPAFVDGLPLCKGESGQILSDLHGLNAAERSGDGADLIGIWLGNALALAGEGAEAEVFRGALRAASAAEAAAPPGAPQAGDEMAGELSRIGRAAILADDGDLRRCLYDVEALLARAPHHVEARLLRERIKRAIATRETQMMRTPVNEQRFSLRPSRVIDFDERTRVAQALYRTALTGGDAIRGGHISLTMLVEVAEQVRRGGLLISGLGGMGKSTLARELLPVFAPGYPDLQLAIDLQATSREPLSAAAAVAHVVRAFLPGVRLPSSLAELTGLYRAVLEGQRALIFLEDARDAAQVEPLLTPPGSALLITSRRRFDLPGVSALSLDRLETTDAAALLQRCAPPLEGAMAETLAEVCGGVPLALRLAGGALRSRPDLTPEAYIERLRDAQSRHDLLDASLRVSFSLLDPILQIVWARLGLFTSRFHIDAVGITGALSPPEDMDALVQHGMVEHDPETGLYHLPRSARSLSTSMLTDADLATMDQRFTQYVAATGDRDLVGRRPHGSWPRGLERALGAARRAGHRPAEAMYLERMANGLGDGPRAAELMDQALALYRGLGDRAGEDRVLKEQARWRDRRAEQERDRLAVEAWRETARIAAEARERRVVELSDKVGSSLIGGAIAAAEALAVLREGSMAKQARSAFQIGVLCRDQGDLDNAILALELCVDLMNAIGWGPGTPGAALGLPQGETPADELARLRASRTK